MQDDDLAAVIECVAQLKFVGMTMIDLAELVQVVQRTALQLRPRLMTEISAHRCAGVGAGGLDRLHVAND